MVTWITMGMFDGEAPVGEPNLTALVVFAGVIIAIGLFLAYLSRD